ncbi:hypothetical protein TNCV_2610281 [Trichonephila clavipes]|nr:hypothetical protein TNCV_2610281 [Trichonephila clavipes]
MNPASVRRNWTLAKRSEAYPCNFNRVPTGQGKMRLSTKEGKVVQVGKDFSVRRMSQRLHLQIGIQFPMVWMSLFHGPKGLSVGPNTKEGVVISQGQFGIMKEDFRQDRVTHHLKGHNAFLRDMGSDEWMDLFVNESSLGKFKLDSENTGSIGKKCKGKSKKFQKSANSTR